MKRIKIVIMLLISLVFLATRCESTDCHRAIKFINKYPKDIYVYNSGYGYNVFLDTAFFVTSATNMNKVRSNEVLNRAVEWRDCFEYCIERPNGFNVFILDAEVYENVPKDTILKYRMVLKTIYLNLEEMQDNNWTITFTGE